MWVRFSAADFAFAFLGILFEGVPFLLAGAVISAIFDRFIVNRYQGVGCGVGLGWIPLVAGVGFLLPLCECATVPIVRRMVSRGMPIGHGIAFLLAVPSVNPLVGLSTWAAFRFQGGELMVVMRLVFGWLVATIAGLAAANLPKEWVVRSGGVATRFSWGSAGGSAGRRPAGEGGMSGEELGKEGWRAVMNSAASDFLDMLFYFCLGAAIAAFVGTAFSVDTMLVMAEEPWLGIFGMMGMAGLLSVCSSSDAFVAAGMVAVPSFAKLAFLVYGPIFDVKLFFLYLSFLGWRYVVGLGVGSAVLIGLMCWKIGGWFLP
ncbi:MAG: permease [Chthoniobacterales bacterium]|nr:permease [Chthoniobacterales bacterium]